MHIAPTRSSRISGHLQRSVSSAVLDWLWNGNGGSKGRRASKPSRRQPRQHLELLEPRVLLSADLVALSQGLSTYLDHAETTLESKAFNADLPLVGDNLATTGADFLKQVSSSLTGALTGATPPTTVDGLKTTLGTALNALQLNAPTNLAVTTTGGDGINLNTIDDL